MEKTNIKSIANDAVKGGLLFGAISSLYIIFSFLVINSAAGNIISNILWFVKLVGLIWLMKYMFAKYKEKHKDCKAKTLVIYGTFIALLSAAITAIVSYISYEFLFPDAVVQAFDQMYQLLGQQNALDANTQQSLVEIEGRASVLQMTGTFIWCLLYGWILSLILAPRVCPPNIFEPEDNQN